ncbi:class I SAM-dependent methyltransferase [Lacinutrix sp. C3R15]|uniref:class I SAM-dependent methyltransferase n=1 Tax=Flavobacteriaceae TaxID=49546 RepID=UPI001C08B2F0|nr:MULTISPECIES: class I SAM-dependent methyltransferase [Flavobacteriaceae]MBU2940450.1 class I SAM-dependent methyltransferase [Lacinutrix sp. C3R15]MDO6623770.1 class I SAM-dependent methyltransferase [Oceanihabitans sp. 1_MG-2023]
MKDFWNERYANEEFAYGTEPNVFFKQQLDKLKPGKLLLPAEGEGRNAVYAAAQGWEVTAFDMSVKGKEKALQLAKLKGVAITYEVVGVEEFKTDEKFDAIGLSFVHFPVEIRKKAHQNLLPFLKVGGEVVLEGFAKAQLGNASGGPKKESMLFSIEEIKEDFSALEVKLLQENTIELSEGNYHKGKAEVIRFLGVKP